jgi:hypothetical protein
MSTSRNLSILLALSLLTGCGKVSQAPNELTAGAAWESLAGRGSPTSAADGGSEKDAGPGRDALCDGSGDIRLMFVQGGGFVPPYYFFTNPHGAAFFAIDGKCRFFAELNYMRGILSGTLTPAEADQLSADLHWDALAGWGNWGRGKDMGCPDAGDSTLIRARVAASCTCGCDAQAPKGLEAALGKAYDWVQKLTSSGKAARRCGERAHRLGQLIQRRSAEV